MMPHNRRLLLHITPAAPHVAGKANHAQNDAP